MGTGMGSTRSDRQSATSRESGHVGQDDFPDTRKRAMARSRATTQQMAAVYGVTTATVHTWRRKGWIRASRIPGRRGYAYDAADVADSLLAIGFALPAPADPTTVDQALNAVEWLREWLAAGDATDDASFERALKCVLQIHQERKRSP